jgi:hypothetical protein
MPESEEESVRRRVPTKILVRTPRGDLYLISKDAIPEIKHSNDPNRQPHDPRLVEILNETDGNLADHFHLPNPGVKVQIAVVDFD